MDTISYPQMPTGYLAPNKSSGTSLPVFIIIFMVSMSAVFLILRLAIPPQNYAKADNTVGTVSAIECQQMGGKIVSLASGRSGCDVSGARFTIISKK